MDTAVTGPVRHRPRGSARRRLMLFASTVSLMLIHSGALVTATIALPGTADAAIADDDRDALHALITEANRIRRVL